MIELWKARRARRSAVAMIAPLVERSRLRGSDIPAGAWLDPYLIGFMTMLITLLARQRGGALRSNTLALVQAEAWAEITGLAPEVVGEEACLLSAVDNPRFGAGCRDAGALFEALDGRPLPTGSGDSADWAALAEHVPAGRLSDFDPRGPATRQAAGAVDLLWREYFEAHLV